MARKRISTTFPAFSTEAEIDAALAEMRRQNPAKQEETWRHLQPRIAAFVRGHWSNPVKGKGAAEWSRGIADNYYRQGKWRSIKPPAGYEPEHE